jgi:nucleoside-diphosphate-sugar epimerase
MKKILLTGADGFTGKHLNQVLTAKGYTVVGLVHKNPKGDQVSCDLTNKDEVLQTVKLIKPDSIIHLAALSFVAHSIPSQFYDVNIFGTLNLLESVFELGLNVNKIIVASSANIYGNPQVEYISEKQILAPINHYATSKVAMEYMVNLWFDKLPIIITRPFNYTGIGQRENFLIPKIVKHYKERASFIELGNTAISRDFSDVRDIASNYADLLESDYVSEVFNLCSGKATSLNSIIRMMNEIAGYEMEVKVNPAFVRKDEIKLLRGDRTKLSNYLSYTEDGCTDIFMTLQDMYNEIVS